MQNIDNEELIKLIESLKEKGFIYNEADFCKKTGINKTFLSDMKAGRRTISEQTVQKIEQTFPEYFGVISGDNNTVANNIGGDNNQNSGSVIEVLSRQLEEKDKQIGRLLSIIENMNTKK